jgi:single-strand DNA-binding protein
MEITMSVNRVFILGRLTHNPELKQTSSGQSVCSLAVATNESWKDKNGQKQERTEFHKVVAWGNIAENCQLYLSKGSQVFVEGRLQTRSYEGKDGQTRYATEIQATSVQFLGGKPSQQQVEQAPQPPRQPGEDHDEPLPF